jgi:hypothetical protein
VDRARQELERTETPADVESSLPPRTMSATW